MMAAAPPDIRWLGQVPIRRRAKVPTDGIIHDVTNPTAHGILVLLSGTARVSLVASDGRERMISFVPTGSIFGEQTTLTKIPITSNLMVFANNECLIGEITHEDILKALAKQPSLLFDILSVIAGKTAELLSEFERTLFGNCQAQLATLLLAFKQPDGYVLISQDRLAHLAGKTRVTVGANLHQLCAMGAIRLERAKICILNEAALIKISGRMH